jgi:hypothetical protein
MQVPSDTPTKAKSSSDEPAYGAIVVVTGVIAVVAVAIVAMLQYPQDATMVVTALGPVVGIIGTLVGAYFGLRGSSLGHAKAAEAEIKRAEISAGTATP